MNLEHKRIGLVFAVTLFSVLCLPALFPSWRLIFFAPFLVILYYQKSYLSCLWISLSCGLLLDLLSAHERIGLHAVDYCLTTFILYKQRRHFFADSLTTLPIMTYLFSAISTLLQLGLIYIFQYKVQLSWEWVFTDLIYMPAMDALYAFVCFIFPAAIFGKRQRRGKEYFMDGSSLRL
jgi:rod shape-determining protein MreD